MTLAGSDAVSHGLVRFRRLAAHLLICVVVSTLLSETAAPPRVSQARPDRASSALEYGLHLSALTRLSSDQRERVRDLAAASEAGWVRVGVSWSQLMPSPNRLRNQMVDNLVRQFRRRDLKIVLLVMGTPDWASSAPGCPHHCRDGFRYYPPRDFGDWQRFISSLAAHFAEGCAHDPDLCVHAYEIWNEPTGSALWRGTPEEYGRLLSVAYDAIHQTYDRHIAGGLLPDPLVLNGGLTFRGTLPPDEWLRRALDNPDYPAARKLDRPTIHVRGTAADVIDKARFWRAQFDRYASLAARPVWITEFAYPSTPRDQQDPAYRGTDKRSGERAQARYYQDVLPALGDTVRSSSGDRGAIFVSLADDPQAASRSLRHEGLVYSDLVTRKEAFGVLRAFARAE